MAVREAAGETGIDGRVQRAVQNRHAIVEALLALYRDGARQPTASQVAQRAGVSLRSVFHHFADMESLYAAVAARQFERLGPLGVAPPADLAIAERIRVLVDRRAELFETVAPVRRAARAQVHRSPTIADNLSRAAALLRAQVEETCAPELSRLARDARSELLDALDCLTSWEAWERLRSGQHLSVSRAKRVVTRALAALLETH